jgi:hypothetical protein
MAQHERANDNELLKELLMTQRDAKRDDGGAVKVGVYDDKPARAATTTTTTMADGGTKPTDLVRWGPIMAGLFAALATLITLSILGIAIGLSTFDANAPLSNFGIGAGIWGAISALLAFLVGGWIAGRASALTGHSNGILNGAMVWFVAIPLLLYLLGSGVGSLVRTAGSVAGTAVQAGAAAAGGAAQNPALAATAQAAVNDPTTQAAGADAIQSAQATAQAVVGQVTPERVETAVNNAGPAAWGTLLSLGLAAAAAIGGGYLGSRPRDPVVVSRTTARA